MEKDMVKNPAHYTEGRKYQPKDVIRDWGLGFCLGNALKYIARAGRKDDIVQDLKKAQEYLQFEIDDIEAERKKVEPSVDCINCRCSFEPVFAEMENGVGKSVGMMRVVIPSDTPPEKIAEKVAESIAQKMEELLK